VPYGNPMHCVETMPEPCAPCWSHVCHMGAMWEPDGAIWEANGTTWELHHSQMGAIWEWCVHCMGAMCAMWEPDGALWEVYAAI
jgi:hypothetical protein